MNQILKTDNRRAVLMYALLGLIALVWLALIVLPPWLIASGHSFSAMSLYRGLSGFCHQRPERSFHLLGYPLAVCSRCTGIYVGFIAGLAIYPLFRSLNNHEIPRRFWLVVAALPMLADFSGEFMGLFSNTFFSRTATGSLFGATVAFFFLPTWATIVSPALPKPSDHSFKENYSA